LMCFQFAADWPGRCAGLGAARAHWPVNVQIAVGRSEARLLAGFALGAARWIRGRYLSALSSLSFRPDLEPAAGVQPHRAAGATLLAYLGAACLRAAAKGVGIRSPIADPVADPIAADDRLAPGRLALSALPLSALPPGRLDGVPRRPALPPIRVMSPGY